MLEIWHPLDCSKPTLAECAVDRFKQQIHPDGTKRTVSLVTICNWMGAKREDLYPWPSHVIKFSFSDGSWCTSRGRGNAHEVKFG